MGDRNIIVALGFVLIPATASADPGTVFINFDGPTLSEGSRDDASSDVTAIAELGLTVDPFGDDAAQRRAVVEAVKADFEPFGLRVVDERPSSGDYIMAVVTPTNPFVDGVTGVAVNDCDDADGPTNVVFAFFSGPGDEALDVATTICLLYTSDAADE